MNKWLGISLLIPFLLAGCTSNHTSNVIPQGPPHQQNVTTAPTGIPKNEVGMIKDAYSNHVRIYLIIDTMKVSKIGKRYGTIQSYQNEVPTSQGLFSDSLSPNSTVYEIPGVNPIKALAVEWKGHYVKAVNSNQDAT